MFIKVRAHPLYVQKDWKLLLICQDNVKFCVQTRLVYFHLCELVTLQLDRCYNIAHLAGAILCGTVHAIRRVVRLSGLDPDCTSI